MLFKFLKMKKVIIILILITQCAFSQVGINTTNPEGVLDITTTNDTGLVLPRVSMVENVTDGDGNPPVNGTVVFDTSRMATCFYQNNVWTCIERDVNGEPVLTDPLTPSGFSSNSPYTYVKATNTEFGDQFGFTALSGDGNTLAVGAIAEASLASGINGNQSDNSGNAVGAVYVYRYDGMVWAPEAYIKPSNPTSNDTFGWFVKLSFNGNTLAVSAFNEDGDGVGVNDVQNDNQPTSGAVYVYERSGANWSQQAYIKAPAGSQDRRFGSSIDISNDGNRLAIGMSLDRSNATGVNGDFTASGNLDSGAVFLYVRSGTIWTFDTYFKASNPGVDDFFASHVTISGDGNTLAVVAHGEDSSATGINGNQADNSATSSGAVYLFRYSSSTWTQEAYIKASNTDLGDFIINSALSDDGNTLAVGATGEDSSSAGINGDQSNNSFSNAGAVYVFRFTAGNWVQEAYLKASNSSTNDRFGAGLHLSASGDLLAVSATSEDSNAIEIGGDETNNSLTESGAVYIFRRENTSWTQEAYVKASNTGTNDGFGSFLQVSSDGTRIAIAAVAESSSSTGINGDQADNSAALSGAVYIIDEN